jgi:hypothetical protein
MIVLHSGGLETTAYVFEQVNGVWFANPTGGEREKMINGIIGRKVGMTQVFEKSGKAIPVTVIQAGPCPVVQLKTKEKDGYQAVQLGFGWNYRPQSRHDPSL